MVVIALTVLAVMLLAFPLIIIAVMVTFPVVTRLVLYTVNVRL